MDVAIVTPAIKQLLIGAGKFIQDAATFEQAEERIMNLEESDDQFHKYELVKFVKAEIEECVGPIVDEEIERYNDSTYQNFSDTDTLVTRITDKVTSSQQFVALKEDISKAVHDSVERLVENFEDEFRLVDKEDPPLTPKQRDPCQLSDEESMWSSSYNHERFLFVTIEQVKKNIEHLDKKNNIQTRLAAIKDLLQVTLHEVLTSDESHQREWARLERVIVDALSDQTEPLLQKKALSFISRGFASSHGNSNELYSILITFLYEYFTNKKQPSIKVKNGLDTTKPDFNILLLAFRLMNDFQKIVPNYWVRYPARFLNDVMEKTISLMAISGEAGMSVQPSMHATPTHFLALLDPKAEWFMRWTHGCFSRLPIFTVMKKQKAFLENLVKSILEFVASRRVPFDLVSEASESLASHRGTVGSHQQRFTYTGEELEYIYFVHAISIVGRILMYKQGFQLFPLKVKGYEGEITITKLICSICQLVTNPAGHGLPMRNITAVYEPSMLATDVLKKLSTSESTYQACLCRDQVTSTLLQPILHWLDSSIPDGTLASDATLLNVADILSIMATRSAGRRHILYGEGGDTFSRSSSSPVSMTIDVSSPAHCLTEFCKKALNKSLPAVHGQVPKPVAGSYLFLCRHLYNNGEGLQAIYSCDLHSILGQVWNSASKAISTISKGKLSKQEEDNVAWEERLKDNLLNFATTPKGVLLMQQANAMQACVGYMCVRHQRKQQVSSLEKFGYGTIISQIASTPCGILEMKKQGLVSALCQDAWNSLEPGEEFEIPFRPMIWSVDAIDKSTLKPLVNLLHIFSNFTSVFELIGGEKLPVGVKYSFRDKVYSLIDLIDRVVMLNAAKDESKIHFLFHYEQSHVFGLRLLNSLICCLDTLLLMDSQFSVVSTLISSQTAEDISSSGTIIIDSLSMERNHVLARALLIGGPSERVLPQQTLTDSQVHTPTLPLITSTTLPKEYIPNIVGKSSIKQETEISKFLSESKSSKLDASWLEKCKTAFCKSTDGKLDSIKGNVIQDVLERTVVAMSSIKSEALFLDSVSDSETSFKSFKLTTLQELGVTKAVQYGVHLKLLTSTHDSQENLTKLLKHAGFYLKQQQRQVGSHLQSLNSNYVGFDWFAATIFLIMRGSYERSWKLLQSYATLSASAYMWAPRMHRSIHLPANLASSSIPPLLFSSCHNIELLMQVELPLVYSAFRMSGFTASQICQLWLKQCFWNYLDWSEVCSYVTICTLLGVDYQVYMCIAILRHLQQHILHHQQQQNLVIFLREQPIIDFKVGKHLEYMKRLESRYRRTVLADMLNFSKP